MINGEIFLIEANRLHKLSSKQKPGVAYEVALRVAPTQQLKLNSVQFEYDRLGTVEDDRGPLRRTVRLTHELGFSMLITELGGPLKPEDQDEFPGENTVVLTDGTCLVGRVAVETPRSQSRLVDKLNHAERFIPIISDESVDFVQRDHVLRLD